MKPKTSLEKDHADRAAILRRFVPKGARVATMTTLGKGETDYVRVFVAHNGAVEEITPIVAKHLELTRTDKGIAMRGGGYEKGFDVVHTLALALYRDGYALSHDRL